MTWPGTPGFIKTNLDAGTDSPATARSDLHNALTDLENVIAGRNQADGVCPLDATSKVPTANLPTIPIANIPAMPLFNGFFRHEAAIVGATFTVPAGITKVKVILAGGGGGGGYAAAAGGGGGGAGATMVLYLTVTPAQVLTYTVGGKGIAAPGPTDGDGTAGTNSTITVGASTFTARGGGGGESNGDFGLGGEPDFDAVITNRMMSSYGADGGYGTTKGGMGGSAVYGPAGRSRNWGGGGHGGGNSVPAADGGDGGIAIEW